MARSVAELLPRSFAELELSDIAALAGAPGHVGGPTSWFALVVRRSTGAAQPTGWSAHQSLGWLMVSYTRVGEVLGLIQTVACAGWIAAWTACSSSRVT